MKIKNKGKVYPSPSSSSSAAAASSSSSSTRDQESHVLSVLKLLPAAILTLASVLSLEDREVLAYMITRSMKPTISNTTITTSVQDSKKKSKKAPHSATPAGAASNNHKGPIFDCDCFDCYTSYWFRWDSSPNRELIHQVIEAFEDHLTSGEQPKKPTRGKKRDKASRRVGEKPVLDLLDGHEMAELSSPPPENDDSFSLASSASPDGGEEVKENDEVSEEVVPEEAAEEVVPVVVRSPAGVGNHKGLARKVLPDVLGLLNSRLWNLWGPNV